MTGTSGFHHDASEKRTRSVKEFGSPCHHADRDVHEKGLQETVMGGNLEKMTCDDYHGRNKLLCILMSMEFSDKEIDEWMKMYDDAHAKTVQASERYAKAHGLSLQAYQRQRSARHYKKLHPNYVPGLYNGKKPWTRLIQGKSYCVSCGRLVQYKPINCSAEQHHVYYEKILKKCNERNRRRKK